jgi:preprotein translocase subunit SecA
MEESHRAQVGNLIGTLSQEAARVPEEKIEAPQHLVASHEEMGQFGEAKTPEEKKAPAVEKVTGERVGRNDPCPCGSGKKFKKCHGA